jgi:hypothetical protein
MHFILMPEVDLKIEMTINFAQYLINWVKKNLKSAGYEFLSD